MSSHCKNERGFTLLEILIAIFLLTIIGLATTQAITETYRLRDILSHEGEFYNSIRMSMGILGRDVGLVFTPEMLMPEKKTPATPAPGANPAETEVIQSGEMANATPFWGPAIDKSGIRPMRFIGTEKKLSFVALSNIRVYKDSPESEFLKVTYELRDDQSPDAIEDTQVLTRMISPNAFEEDDMKDTYKKTYPLLHGVSKISFKYFEKDKESGVTSWDSDTGEFKNRYPDYIEVTVEVKGPHRLSFDGVYRFRPEIPLNGLPATL